MPRNSRPARRLPDASQSPNRGANAAGSFDTKPSSGSPRGVPAMKAGKVGAYTSKSRIGSATNPGNAGYGSGKGGLGSARGS